MPTDSAVDHVILYVGPKNGIGPRSSEVIVFIEDKVRFSQVRFAPTDSTCMSARFQYQGAGVVKFCRTIVYGACTTRVWVELCQDDTTSAEVSVENSIGLVKTHNGT